MIKMIKLKIGKVKAFIGKEINGIVIKIKDKSLACGYLAYKDYPDKLGDLVDLLLEKSKQAIDDNNTCGIIN
jgi:hypothetical protein